MPDVMTTRQVQVTTDEEKVLARVRMTPEQKAAEVAQWQADMEAALTQEQRDHLQSRRDVIQRAIDKDAAADMPLILGMVEAVRRVQRAAQEQNRPTLLIDLVRLLEEVQNPDQKMTSALRYAGTIFHALLGEGPGAVAALALSEAEGLAQTGEQEK